MQRLEHPRRDLAGEGAFLLPVQVLRAERHREVLVLDDVLDGAQRGGGRTDDDLDAVVVLLAKLVADRPDERNSLEVGHVHLPVARDDRLAVAHARAAFASAAMPGSSRPSRNSNDAPPPVLAKSISPPGTSCRIADCVSPPPVTV